MVLKNRVVGVIVLDADTFGVVLMEVEATILQAWGEGGGWGIRGARANTWITTLHHTPCYRWPNNMPCYKTNNTPWGQNPLIFTPRTGRPPVYIMWPPYIFQQYGSQYSLGTFSLVWKSFYPECWINQLRRNEIALKRCLCLMRVECLSLVTFPSDPYCSLTD